MKLTSIGKVTSFVFFILWLAFLGALVAGWIMNIFYLIQCDFEPSYKAEILRTVGVFFPPMGIFLGYSPNLVGK